MFKLGPAASLVLLVAASQAVAAGGPDASRMSCGAAVGLVAQSGAMVLATGPHTYDRYVVDQRFCALAQTATATWIATADTPQCFIGFRCKDKYNEGSSRE